MLPTVFVYDGHPGGAGFAERGFGAAADWLRATRDAIAACECATGCPSCVQSPKCGNGNNPLDKAGAVRLLDRVLRDAGPARADARTAVVAPHRCTDRDTVTSTVSPSPTHSISDAPLAAATRSA
jgi:DEAD/DEAH box helicase domain-containing protein